MRGKILVFAIAVLVGVLPSFASAQTSRPYLVASSGVSTTIDKYAAIDPDCRSLGPVQISLVEAPSSGEVSLGSGRDYVAFPPANPRSACNHRKLATTRVIYRSSPGFVGTVTFVVESVSTNSIARTTRYTITVR